MNDTIGIVFVISAEEYYGYKSIVNTLFWLFFKYKPQYFAYMKNENAFPRGTEQEYTALQIELIEVESSHNILNGSTAPLSGFSGGDW